MFSNIKILKSIVLLLFVYSVGSTVFFFSNSGSASSNYEGQINQLNAQIANLQLELANAKKENDDTKAIRAMMEKDQAVKDAAQKRHEESLSDVPDQFKGLDGYDGRPDYGWE